MAGSRGRSTGTSDSTELSTGGVLLFVGGVAIGSAVAFGAAYGLTQYYASQRESAADKLLRTEKKRLRSASLMVAPQMPQQISVFRHQVGGRCRVYSQRQLSPRFQVSECVASGEQPAAVGK